MAASTCITTFFMHMFKSQIPNVATPTVGNERCVRCNHTACPPEQRNISILIELRVESCPLTTHLNSSLYSLCLMEAHRI